MSTDSGPGSGPGPDPQTDSGPGSGPGSDPQTDSGPGSGPGPHPQTDSGPGSGPGSDPQTDPCPGPDPQTDPGPGPDPQTDPGPGSGPGSDPQTDSGPGSDPQTDSGPGSDPQTDSGPGSDPQTDSGPGPGPGSDPQTDPGPGSGPGSDPQTDPGPGSGPGPDPQTDSGPGPDPQTDSGPGPDPQTDSGPGSGPGPDPQTDPGPGSGPGPDPQTNPGPGSGPGPDPQTDSGPGPDPQTDSGPGSGPGPDPQTDSGPGLDPQTDPGPGSGPGPDPQTDSGPGPDPQTDSGPGSGPGPDPQTDSGPGLDPQTDPGPGSGPGLDPQTDQGPGSGPGPDPQGPVQVQVLLDLLLGVYQEFSCSGFCQEKFVSGFLTWAGPIVRRVEKMRIKRDDFDILKVIGRGSFSEVAVAKMRRTQQVYALKIMNKWHMLRRGETACYQEEREVMLKGDRRWITQLHYAFQDNNHLYLVMDFYPGGDLLTLLSKFGDVIPEDMAQFYLAEMVMAVDCVHKLGYVHRDIKPDNVLLAADGHVKLGDFGSCLRLQSDGMIRSLVAVGTPDYLSPEILRTVEGNGGYGLECDWWALGICGYEMLVGTTPFYAESISETYAKIINFQDNFQLPPPDSEMSDEASSFIAGLVCDRENRLGRNGLGDFRTHRFFSEIDWDSLHDLPAPFLPDVSGPADTSNFDIVDDCLSEMEMLSDVEDATPLGVHLAFVGYSYTAASAVDFDRDIVTQTEETKVEDTKVEVGDPFPPEELMVQLADSLQEKLSPLLGAAVTPLAAAVTPLGAAVTPLGAAVTPLGAAVTPLGAAVTPLGAAVTPLAAAVTPLGAAVTPLGAAVTPLAAAVTPLAAAVTPLAAAVTPLAAAVTPLGAAVTPLGATSTSTHITTDAEEETKLTSPVDEHMQRALHEATRRCNELEKESMSLKEEIQHWRAAMETEVDGAPYLPLPAGDSPAPPPAALPPDPPAAGEE
ncbi:serine/threonine-protein kinase MRCK gamma-like isoform X2 [Cololabis saira]|uniref:serine/threonine-protein kinase MRCK gamma-like isoform X2 n=1 Tax=Cololabis saira TaxID=129043 RepID=UPI002AD52897|nr:serine/threonine-protein kinase MRCK gamma-like isoform X2 [Cololabis saira]